MKNSSMRASLRIVFLGFIMSPLAFWSGCANQRPDSTAAIPNSSVREEADQPAGNNQTETPGPAQAVAGPEPALFAVMDLSQEAESPIRIVSRDDLIALFPGGPHAYTGHLDLTIQSDSDVLLTASIAAIRPMTVVGDYLCMVSPSRIAAPGGTVAVRVAIDKAGLGNTPPGSKIATVKLLPAGQRSNER